VIILETTGGICNASSRVLVDVYVRLEVINWKLKHR